MRSAVDAVVGGGVGGIWGCRSFQRLRKLRRRVRQRSNTRFASQSISALPSWRSLYETRVRDATTPGALANVLQAVLRLSAAEFKLGLAPPWAHSILSAACCHPDSTLRVLGLETASCAFNVLPDACVSCIVSGIRDRARTVRDHAVTVVSRLGMPCLERCYAELHRMDISGDGVVWFRSKSRMSKWAKVVASIADQEDCDRFRIVSEGAEVSLVFDKSALELTQLADTQEPRQSAVLLQGNQSTL